MYLAFRNEIRFLIAWELKYDYYWMDHVLQMMTGCDPETLTMKIEDEDEDRRMMQLSVSLKGRNMTKPSTSRLGPHFFVFDAK